MKHTLRLKVVYMKLVLSNNLLIKINCRKWSKQILRKYYRYLILHLLIYLIDLEPKASNILNIKPMG